MLAFTPSDIIPVAIIIHTGTRSLGVVIHMPVNPYYYIKVKISKYAKIATYFLQIPPAALLFPFH